MSDEDAIVIANAIWNALSEGAEEDTIVDWVNACINVWRNL